jgi:hypothetical protein
VVHAETPAELTKSGLAKLKGGDLAGAVADLDRAAQLDPSAPILFNLAQAEIKLGKLASAERHLKEAKVLAEQSGPKALIDLSERTLGQLADRVPKLEIVSVPDAEQLELKLDGKAIKGVDHRINPGPHELTASAEGFQSHTEKFTAAEGKTVSLSFSLSRKQASKAANQVSTQSEASPGLPIGPVVLGAAGLVAAGTGVYFYTRVSAIDDDRIAAHEAAGCPGPNCPREPESARLLREDSEQAALLGNVLVGVGAAAVVGAGVWWMLSRSGDPKEPSVGLSVGPGQARLHGRF